MNKQAIRYTAKFLLIAGILGGAAGYFIRIEAGISLAPLIGYFMQQSAKKKGGDGGAGESPDCPTSLS